MRKFERFLRWANVAFYFVAFLVLLGFGVVSYWDRGGTVVREMRHSPLYWVITAFFGLLFVLQFLARDRGLQRLRRRDYLRVVNADGEIAVSLRAVEESLCRTAASLADLAEVEVRVHVMEEGKRGDAAAGGATKDPNKALSEPVRVPAEAMEGSKAGGKPVSVDGQPLPPVRLVEGRGVVVRAHYVTYEGLNVGEIHEKLQQLLKARFREIIDIDDLPPFVVVLTDIIPKEETRREARKRKKEQEEEMMFTGPRYF